MVRPAFIRRFESLPASARREKFNLAHGSGKRPVAPHDRSWRRSRGVSVPDTRRFKFLDRLLGKAMGRRPTAFRTSEFQNASRIEILGRDAVAVGAKVPDTASASSPSAETRRRYFKRNFGTSAAKTTNRTFRLPVARILGRSGSQVHPLEQARRSLAFAESLLRSVETGHAAVRHDLPSPGSVFRSSEHVPGASLRTRECGPLADASKFGSVHAESARSPTDAIRPEPLGKVLERFTPRRKIFRPVGPFLPADRRPLAQRQNRSQRGATSSARKGAAEADRRLSETFGSVSSGRLVGKGCSRGRTDPGVAESFAFDRTDTNFGTGKENPVEAFY